MIAETNSLEYPTSEQIANFFNSHGVDSVGDVTDYAMPILPGMGDDEGSSMNSYFIGFAAVAVVLYFFKKRNTEDEDGLYMRQKEHTSSLLDYIKNPFNKKDGDDSEPM